MKKKVLIVDDIKEFLIMLRIILSRDYEVVVAKNGAQALEKIRDGFCPDVIVTDLHMPVMDGYDLISSIKTQDDLKKVPIIVMSNSDRNKEKQEVLKQGVYTYVRKSFVPQEFRYDLENSLTTALQYAS